MKETFEARIETFSVTHDDDRFIFYDKKHKKTWVVVKLAQLRIVVMMPKELNNGKQWGTTFYREPKSTFDPSMSKSFLVQALMKYHNYIMNKRRKLKLS